MQIVCHAEKLPELGGMGNHCSRVGYYDAQGKLKNPDKHDYIKNPGNYQKNQGEGSLIRDWKKAVEGLGRAPQKNASPAVAFVISASPEFFPGKDHIQIEMFFKAARKALKELYPDGPILQWATHYDETTPHMHVLMAPIVKAKRRKKGGVSEEPAVIKFSSGEFLGGPAGLTRLQDKMGELGESWGLDRGLAGSKRTHTDQYEWRIKTEYENKLKEELEKMKGIQKKEILDELEDRRKEILDKLEDQRNELIKKETALEDREKEISTKETNIKTWADEIQDRETEVKKKEEWYDRGMALLEKDQSGNLSADLRNLFKGMTQDQVNKFWETAAEWCEEARTANEIKKPSGIKNPGPGKGR